MKNLPRFKRNRLSQAVTLACFAIASAPVMAGTGSCPSTGSNNISTAQTASCVLDTGDSVRVTASGSIKTNAIGVYVYNTSSGGITNNGVIDSDTSAGIYLYHSTVNGSITNNGLLESDEAGLYIYFSSILGDITNTGTIFTSGSSSEMGIRMGDSIVTGSVTNSGLIDTFSSGGADYDGIYIYNSTIVGDLHNTSTGVITSGEIGMYIYGTNIGGSLINDGTIIGTSGYSGIGIMTSSTGGSIINRGLISTATVGDEGDTGLYVYNSNIGGDIHNTSSGVIDAADRGIYIYGTSIGGSLTNDGTIIARDNDNGIGIATSNIAGSITNRGLISTTTVGDEGDIGLYVYKSNIGGDIRNTSSGVIESDETGVYIYDSTISGSIINNGLIDAGERGIYIYESTVGGSIINTGTIIGRDDEIGLEINNTNVGGSIINSGLIFTNDQASEGYDGIYVYNANIGGDIHNTSSGVIDSGEVGIYVYASTIRGSIINDGTILSDDYPGLEINTATVLGSITNSGLINATSGDGLAVYVYNSTVIGDISNSGTIVGNDQGYYIYGSTVAGDIKNSGTLIGALDGGGYGYYVYGTSANSISNSGLVIGGIYMEANTPTTFTNSGTISTKLINSFVDDNYTQTADGVFRLDATDATTYGDLTVNGTAKFAAGSGLQVGFTEGAIVAGDTLVDVITAGTLSASSFKVGDNLLSMSFSAAIDGNTVDLTAANTGLTTITAATLAAGYSGGAGVAGVLDTLLTDDPFGEIAFAFGSLSTEQEVANSVESVAPALSGGLAQASHSIGSAFTDVVGSRQDAENGISSGDKYFVDGNMWLKPFGGWTEQDDRDGVSGYDIDSYGLAFGVDADVPSSSWTIGAAFAYIKSDVESDIAVGSQDVDVKTYLGKIYASYKLDDVTVINLQGGVGKSDYDSKRVIFNGAVARADYDSTHYQASAELVRSYQINAKTRVSPYVHADYMNVDVDDYIETGAGFFNLTVGDDSNDSLILGAGVKGGYSASDDLLLTGNVGVGYDAMADRTSLTSSFAGGGAQFTTQGIDPDELVYNVGVGGKYSVGNNTEVTARYSLNGRDDYTDQTIGLNVRWNFY